MRMLLKSMKLRRLMGLGVQSCWGADICDKYKASLSKVDEFTCYTHAQSCNTESCIATIAIQLPKVD